MNESNIFGVSVRALLAVIIVVSCCGLCVWLQKVDILKDLSLVAVSFYFGQKSQGGSNVTQGTGSVINSTDTVAK